MTAAFTTLSLLVLAAAASGCVCTCITAEVEPTQFESACEEHGGRVQSAATDARQQCIADAGVIATWVVDEDGGTIEEGEL